MVQAKASHEIKILHKTTNNKTSRLEILKVDAETELPCNQVKKVERLNFERNSSEVQSHCTSDLNHTKGCHPSLHYRIKGESIPVKLSETTLKGVSDLNKKH